MAPQAPFVLVAIDDDPQSLELISEAIAEDGLEILTASDAAQGLQLVLEKRPDMVIVDLIMPGMNGLELLDRIVEAAPGTDVILITGHYTTDSAVEAIKRGACDYLTKPVSIDVLRQRVGKLISEARRRMAASDLEAELAGASSFQGMVGRSPLMMQVFARILRVAMHYRTALVAGATGTGKELVARALHDLSPVASGPFVVCNCSAVVETLFESELFGYARGAFTGALRDKPGLFEHADGGTLFLDELGDLPLSMQSKLLRALQSQEIQRVGSPAVRHVNVRVIAATNRDLVSMTKKGDFREDLYYRLSMVEIKLPPLLERKDDLPLLVRHLVDKFSREFNKPIRGLTQRAQVRLTRYNWPGNVRELENILGSACMMTEGTTIDVTDLPETLQAIGGTRPEVSEDEMLPLSEVEKRHTLHILRCTKGNKVKAAEVLGISRATLYRILEDAAHEEDEKTTQP